MRPPGLAPWTEPPVGRLLCASTPRARTRAPPACDRRFCAPHARPDLPFPWELVPPRPCDVTRGSGAPNAWLVPPHRKTLTCPEGGRGAWGGPAGGEGPRGWAAGAAKETDRGTEGRGSGPRRATEASSSKTGGVTPGASVLVAHTSPPSSRLSRHGACFPEASDVHPRNVPASVVNHQACDRFRVPATTCSCAGAGAAWAPCMSALPEASPAARPCPRRRGWAASDPLP